MALKTEDVAGAATAVEEYGRRLGQVDIAVQPLIVGGTPVIAIAVPSVPDRIVTTPDGPSSGGWAAPISRFAATLSSDQSDQLVLHDQAR